MEQQTLFGSVEMNRLPHGCGRRRWKNLWDRNSCWAQEVCCAA